MERSALLLMYGGPGQSVGRNGLPGYGPSLGIHGITGRPMNSAHLPMQFFAYANYMNEDTFNGIIGSPLPLEIAPVVAENAWLSFDYCGVPFVEPAYPSLIIRGYNDKITGETHSQENDPTYLRYIHDRCYPGIPFTSPGELPPPVEGIAYRITTKQMTALGVPSGFRIAEVHCTRLVDTEDGAHKKSSDMFTASCLVAKEKYRSSCMMPTITSYANVYRGALTHGFSLRYMRHLSQLRPYNLANASNSVRLARRAFVCLILGPQFALFYLPLVLAQRVLGDVARDTIDHLKLLVSDFIRCNAIIAERFFFRPFVGRAGYTIDY